VSGAQEIVRAGLCYRLAGAADEAELRALLQPPLPGWVALSFEREPHYFAAAASEGERHAVLLARELKSGRLAGYYSRAVRPAYINGERQWLGYLGQLRVAPAFRGGYHYIRHGFAAGRALLRRPDELPFDLTSILGDNHPARRLLTADLPGMPRYSPLSPLLTWVFRSRRGALPSGLVSGGEVGLAAIADCLQRNLRRAQCAPYWDPARLTQAGLSADDFLVIQGGGQVTACAAVWDLRAVKQAVVRGYRPPIQQLRLLLNGIAPLLGLPRLPPLGSVLRQGYLSHLACDADDGSAAALLLRGARAQAARRGLDSLLLGTTPSHPLAPPLARQGRHLEYRSQLYLVHWPELPPPLLDQRPLQVELATL